MKGVQRQNEVQANTPTHGSTANQAQLPTYETNVGCPNDQDGQIKLYGTRYLSRGYSGGFNPMGYNSQNFGNLCEMQTYNNCFPSNRTFCNDLCNCICNSTPQADEPIRSVQVNPNVEKRNIAVGSSPHQEKNDQPEQPKWSKTFAKKGVQSHIEEATGTESLPRKSKSVKMKKYSISNKNIGVQVLQTREKTVPVPIIPQVGTFQKVPSRGMSLYFDEPIVVTPSVTEFPTFVSIEFDAYPEVGSSPTPMKSTIPQSKLITPTAFEPGIRAPNYPSNRSIPKFARKNSTEAFELNFKTPEQIVKPKLSGSLTKMNSKKSKRTTESNATSKNNVVTLWTPNFSLDDTGQSVTPFSIKPSANVEKHGDSDEDILGMSLNYKSQKIYKSGTKTFKPAKYASKRSKTNTETTLVSAETETTNPNPPSSTVSASEHDLTQKISFKNSVPNFLSGATSPTQILSTAYPNTAVSTHTSNPNVLSYIHSAANLASANTSTSVVSIPPMFSNSKMDCADPTLTAHTSTPDLSIHILYPTDSFTSKARLEENGSKSRPGYNEPISRTDYNETSPSLDGYRSKSRPVDNEPNSRSNYEPSSRLDSYGSKSRPGNEPNSRPDYYEPPPRLDGYVPSSKPDVYGSQSIPADDEPIPRPGVLGPNSGPDVYGPLSRPGGTGPQPIPSGFGSSHTRGASRPPLSPDDSVENSRPDGFASTFQPHGFVSPSQPHDFVSPSKPYGLVSPSQPHDFVSPSKPYGLVSPSHPHDFVSPSQPQSFVSPSQRHGFVSPSQPHGFVSPSQPHGFESSSQPHGFESSQPGGFESRTQPGGFESSSQLGGFESRTQPGGFESRTQPGGFESRTQPGGFESRTQPGGFESRTQPGGFESRTQPGGFESRTQPGGFESPSQLGSSGPPYQSGLNVSSFRPSRSGRPSGTPDFGSVPRYVGSYSIFRPDVFARPVDSGTPSRRSAFESPFRPDGSGPSFRPDYFGSPTRPDGCDSQFRHENSAQIFACCTLAPQTSNAQGNQKPTPQRGSSYCPAYVCCTIDPFAANCNTASCPTFSACDGGTVTKSPCFDCIQKSKGMICGPNSEEALWKGQPTSTICSHSFSKSSKLNPCNENTCGSRRKPKCDTQQKCCR